MIADDVVTSSVRADLARLKACVDEINDIATRLRAADIDIKISGYSKSNSPLTVKAQLNLVMRIDIEQT